MIEASTKTDTYACQYCHKEFKSERTLLVHACEQKRRWHAKDEKEVSRLVCIRMLNSISTTKTEPKLERLRTLLQVRTTLHL